MTATVEETARQGRARIGVGIVEAVKRAGPLAFGRTFLRHLVPVEPSPLHYATNRWHVRETQRKPGAQDAVAAPRGHGKSTGLIEIPALYHAAYCTRRFVVIASDTATQAEERLATVIAEIENNAELRAAFPELRPAVDERSQFVRWRDSDIVLACGCRIMAVGAGKAIRGARKGSQRPDLLLLDDLEDEDSVATPRSLEKRLRWILRVALGLAGVGSEHAGLSVLWVGTILSRSALLNQVTGAALDVGQTRPEWARSWTPHVWRAELDGTERVETQATDVDPDSGETFDVVIDGKPLTYLIGEPMWSALTRSDLARIRYKLGAAAYAAEYLSDPVDEATTLLARPRSCAYVNPTAAPLGRVVRTPSGRLIPVASMSRAVALDPQYAEAGQSNDPDLAAIVVAGQYGGDTFLLEAWIGRDRHGQAARLVDAGVRWACYAGGVEAKSAQAVTADQAVADGRLPIVPLQPIDGKVERALGLAVRLGDKERPETCRVFALPDAEQLLPYLETFPHGRYDDPVDATVYAVELAARAAPSMSTSTEAGAAPVTGGGSTR